QAGLADGARGGPLVAADTGLVTGLLATPAGTTGSAPASAAPAFVDAKRIREVLASVGVQPKRGPTDAVFEDAMHSFKNKLYTPPIPSFERALELYPGHALATADLAVAKAKAGTAEDLTGKEGAGLNASAGGAGLPGWVLPVATFVVVLALAAGFLLLRRSRGGQAEPAGGGAAPPKPAAAAGPRPPAAGPTGPARPPRA